MNASKRQLRHLICLFFCLIAVSEVFAQSTTILPASQNNTDTLSTKFLRMTNGAGMFRVMMSDPQGNGFWIDPTFLTDIYWSMNGMANMYQIPDVNLGIGTTSPSYKLDVRATNANTIANFSGNNQNGVGIRISSGVSGTVNGSAVSSEWQIYHSGTGITADNGGFGQLLFKDQTGTKMILRNTGRVGIGVLNPSEMLEVNGNARINGHIDIQNTGLSVFIGEGAGKKDDLTQKYNTFVGFNAGKEVTSGSNNLAIGSGSLENHTTGSFNVAVGRLAMINNISGTSNVAIGANAGFNATGSFNVFLGNSAGADETGNDKLYIHNSNSTTPLIYGDFMNRYVGINDRLVVGANTPSNNLNKFEVVANANGSFLVQNWPSVNNITLVSRLYSKTGMAPQMRFEGAGESGGFIDIGQDTNGSFVIEGKDSPLMVVKSQGQVGIGTQAPASQLEIVSKNTETLEAASSSTSGTLFTLKNSSTGGTTWGVVSTGKNSSDGSGNLLIKEGSTSRMIIKNQTGSVGFGTNTPASQLEVVSSGNETLRATSSSATGTWFAINNTSTGGNNWKFVSTGSSNSEGSGNLLLKDNSGVKMIVKSSGAVGIGTDNPTKARLVITGSQLATMSYGYINASASTGTSSGTNYYSIYASDRIAATEFNAFSDARIKNIQGITNNENDLLTLAKIQITDYTFKDKIGKGNGQNKKVIAQQVETVYPQAVRQITDCIPDIYQLAEAQNNFIRLPNHNLKTGERIKVIFDNKQEVFEVGNIEANGFTILNTEIPVNNQHVFVYGREVSDFRSVDYEALTTLNISATQALLKKLNEAENRITQLEKQQEKILSMEARLIALEKQYQFASESTKTTR